MMFKPAMTLLGGVLSGLTGTWLLVVCFGGLLTLGALSVFHVGVLLSLGVIGIGLVVVGAGALYRLCSKAPSNTQRVEDTPFRLGEESRLSSIPWKTKNQSEASYAVSRSPDPAFESDNQNVPRYNPFD